jgi:hypothetical protein
LSLLAAEVAGSAVVEQEECVFILHILLQLEITI